MLDRLRTMLWETIYLNPATPEDLIKNIDDPDYKTVKSFEKKNGLCVELTFVDCGALVTAIYEFDNNQFLQKVTMIDNEIETVIFDRQQQIKDIMKMITQAKKEPLIDDKNIPA